MHYWIHSDHEDAFFQHYIPETKDCAGYHSFGYNKKEQFWRIVTLPFATLLTAWVCTLF